MKPRRKRRTKKQMARLHTQWDREMEKITAEMVKAGVKIYDLDEKLLTGRDVRIA